MRVSIKYKVVSSLLGTRANSYSVESFDTYEEAVKHWEEQYRDRNKGDGYDEYWRKVPLRIQQIITSDLWEK